MDTFISHSPAETGAFGERLAASVQLGLVIGLVGDLGVGKTELVKGLARGLGVNERVHSPSFSLVNVYSSGRIPLFHMDLYRLESTQQIVEAGLEPYFEPAGISIVEWMDRWGGVLPLHYRLITMESLGPSQRRIIYDDSRP